MDMKTGRVEFLISLKRMAEIAFPQGYTGKTNLYVFREGWNPSGTRFIAFLKNADRPTYTGGWSISADGKVVRGPAAASQPVYEARVTDGKVEVRAAP